MAVSVEEVSSSLVREYLSRKGLKRTIACMDEEHPRTETSINNRSHLRQILNIEDLYRKNKVQNSPLKTLLEIMVKHHIKDLMNDKITSNESFPLQSAQIISPVDISPAVTPTVMNDTKTEDRTTNFIISKDINLRSEIEEISPQPIYTSLRTHSDRLSSHNQTDFWAYDSENQIVQPLVASLQDNEKFIRREPDNKTSITESTHGSRTNRIRRGMMTGPIESKLQESNKKRQNRRMEVPQPLLRREGKNRQSMDGLLMSGLHQKCLESGLTKISSAESVGGRQELLSAQGNVQKENSFEKVGQNILTAKKVKSLTRPAAADLDVSEMVLDDIDDEEDLLEFPKMSFQKTITECGFAGNPMDQHTAMELKAVLLGSSLKCFSVEWRNQGFTFSDMHDLRYGIVQKKVD